MSDCCLTPSQVSNFSTIWMAEEVTFDEIMMTSVLHQISMLEFFSTTSLKHQSMGRHVASIGQIIPIPRLPVCPVTVIVFGSKEIKKIIFLLKITTYCINVHTNVQIPTKLEAQRWAEPVSLTLHSAQKKLNTEHSIAYRFFTQASTLTFFFNLSLPTTN